MSRNLAIRSLDEKIALPILKAVLANADYGILVTGLDHTSLVCNRKFGEIWDVDIERVVTESVEQVRDFVKSRVVELGSWERNLGEIYRDPSAEQVDELTLRNPEAILRRSSRPILGLDEEVIGRLWTFLDVTKDSKRRRMLEALHSAATLMDANPRVVYQGLVDQVAEYFDSWVFLSILKEEFLVFRAMGGRDNPAREVPGNELRDSFCQYCIDKNEPFLIQDARLRPEIPDVLPKREGLNRYAGVPIRRSDGTAYGTLCILDSRSESLLEEDDLQFLTQVATRISGELEREEHLARLEESLQATMGSLETAQKQLVRSEKLAVTGRLAASVAHDIRNILAAIQLHLKNPTRSPAERLSLLDEQMSRFKILSHRLLSYSKPGKWSLAPVDVHESLFDSVSLLESQADRHRVMLSVDLRASDAWASGDPVRLEHLFVNLILNAVQALGTGGAVTVSSWDEGEDSFLISVLDDGPGMDEEQVSQLFEPFSSQKADGFGLGLYSCLEIARAHGSELTCISELGKGTEFRMVFRRVK